jgi:multisubunit Na+/H+ antiporter MnhB subunit
MFATDNPPPGKVFRRALVLILLAIAGWLAYALLALSGSSAGLDQQVLVHLETSGVRNPVTAVLLNFRGYDTLLEMAVLLVALLGVWSLGGIAERRESAPGPTLDTLSRLLVPMLILVAAYLLWTGADAPGGAFQAGSVLGAAGVLLLLSGWRLGQRFAGLLLRGLLVLGLGMFVIVGTVLFLIGGAFLEYPPTLAGGLILLIETAATIAIGVTLAALFLGRQPTAESNKVSKVSPDKVNPGP